MELASLAITVLFFSEYLHSIDNVVCSCKIKARCNSETHASFGSGQRNHSIVLYIE